MSDYYILDAEHNVRPATWEQYLEWAKAGFDATKRVAKDTIGEAQVSTVFLMIDHNWGDGPPIVFETMVFGGEHSEYQRRYHTWDEAVAGHQAIVAALRSGSDLPEVGV